MNFNLVERRDNFDDIREDFQRDYLNSNLKNDEIRKKYDLSHREFKKLSKEVKSKAHIHHRHQKTDGKYFYKHKNGYSIQKKIDGRNTYFGNVQTLEMAEKAVEICEELNWDILECRKAIWELKLCELSE